ncbi:hypothetical protein G6038_13995 [Rhodococcus sp. 14C212]|uniref:hypothetical protein n=1 Tax=Rhodococcus sp. 14C212 TaxID=2711209 RepID=UPI0013EA1FD4|nr:hypothetical protein [Rhodococcus sp. 14C212]NGP06576.1 hypothetical protein [Rhodococcus sp. 14C212]
MRVAPVEARSQGLGVGQDVFSLARRPLHPGRVARSDECDSQSERTVGNGARQFGEELVGVLSPLEQSEGEGARQVSRGTTSRIDGRVCEPVGEVCVEQSHGCRCRLEQEWRCGRAVGVHGQECPPHGCPGIDVTGGGERSGDASADHPKPEGAGFGTADVSDQRVSQPYGRCAAVGIHYGAPARFGCVECGGIDHCSQHREVEGFTGRQDVEHLADRSRLPADACFHQSEEAR